MNMIRVSRLLASLVSVFLLAGCGETPTSVTSSAPSVSADRIWTRDEFGLAAVGTTRSELEAAIGAPTGTRTDSDGEIWYYRLQVRVPVETTGRKDEPILFPALLFRNAETTCVLSGFITPARMDDLLRKMGKEIPETFEGATAKAVEEHRAFTSGKTFQQLADAWGPPQTQTVSSDGNGDAAWQKDGLNISVYFDAGSTASVSIFPLP